jgi:hypothetical protein
MFVYLISCEWHDCPLSFRPRMHLTGYNADNLWNINTIFRLHNSRRKSFVNFFITNPRQRITFYLLYKEYQYFFFFVKDEKRCINPARWSRVGTPQFRYLARKCAPLRTLPPPLLFMRAHICVFLCVGVFTWNIFSLTGLAIAYIRLGSLGSFHCNMFAVWSK